MKPLHYIFTAVSLIFILGLPGCSEGEDSLETAYRHVPILLSPSIEGLNSKPVTRGGVSGLSDLSGKLLVLDIIQSSVAGDPYNYKGLQYTVDNGGNLTLSVEPPKWKAYTGSADRADADIKAQWPLAATIPADQNGTDPVEADFLYYAGKPTVEGDRMKFTLQHVNAKIRINLVLGTGFEWGSATDADKIIQVTTSPLLNNTESENGLWKAGTNGAPISIGSPIRHTAHRETTPASGQYATFELIILPQTITDMSGFLKIAAGIKNYYYDMTGSYAFDSNKTYTFNLRLGKDNVELSGGIGVSGWTQDNTILPGESEDESRVQTLDALTALIASYDAEYGYNTSLRTQIIYSGSDAIGYGVFKDRLWLSRFVATRNINIGTEAFSGCVNLGELVFADKAMMSGITDNTFTGLTTANVKLILGAAEYAAADLSTKTWCGKTWKSITQY